MRAFCNRKREARDMKNLTCFLLLVSCCSISSAQTADSTRPKSRVSAETVLFTGYTRADTAQGRYLTLGPLVPNLIQFNTVEGLVLSQSLDFSQKLAQNRQFLSLGGAVRYGFASRQVYAKGYVSWLFDRASGQSLRLDGGRYVQQFNPDEPVTPLLNTSATLLRGVNFLKEYERQFLTFRYERKVGKRFTLAPSLELARRVALPNVTDFSFRREDRRRFTSNDPQQPEGNDLAFRPHDLIQPGLDAQLDWGENFNRINLSYRQTLPDDGVAPHFSKIRLQYSANWPARRGLGESRLSFSTGTFLWKNKAYFPDYWHFFGNETRALRTQTEAFALLPYYTHSTDRWFVQGFYERHFLGQFLGKIPLFNALAWHELVGLRALLTPERGLYAEATIGLENVFRLYRFDLILAFGDPYTTRLALRYGVAL